MYKQECNCPVSHAMFVYRKTTFYTNHSVCIVRKILKTNIFESKVDNALKNQTDYCLNHTVILAAYKKLWTINTINVQYVFFIPSITMQAHQLPTICPIYFQTIPKNLFPHKHKWCKTGVAPCLTTFMHFLCEAEVLLLDLNMFKLATGKNQKNVTTLM